MLLASCLGNKLKTETMFSSNYGFYFFFFSPADQFRFVTENNGRLCSVLTATPGVSGSRRLEAFRLTPSIVVPHNTGTCRGQSLGGTVTLQIMTVDRCTIAAWVGGVNRTRDLLPWRLQSSQRYYLWLKIIKFISGITPVKIGTMQRAKMMRIILKLLYICNQKFSLQ